MRRRDGWKPMKGPYPVPAASLAYGRFVVVAENIRSLHNVGALFRTCDGAGVTWLFLGGYSGFPPRPEIAKVALGAETWIPWRHVWHLGPLLDDLARMGYQLVGLEACPEAVAIHRFQPQGPLALVVGNEVEGLSPAVRRRVQATVRLPMRGRKESLNVAVAFGIAAYSLAEKLEKGAPECRR